MYSIDEEIRQCNTFKVKSDESKNSLEAIIHTMFGGQKALHITQKTPYQDKFLEVET